MDEVGYIKVEGDTPRTNIEGVYAAGDCADASYRQAIVAAGSGCRLHWRPSATSTDKPAHHNQ